MIVLTRAKVGRAGIFQQSQTLRSLAFFMRALLVVAMVGRDCALPFRLGCV